MSTLQHLQGEHQKVLARMARINEDAGGAELSSEQRAEYDVLLQRSEQLIRQTAPLKRRRERRLDALERAEGVLAVAQDPDVFEIFVRKGPDGLPAADLQALMEARAFTATTAGTGATTVPNEIATSIEIALKGVSAVYNVATKLRTATGAPITLPTVNYTSVAGGIGAENSAGTLDTSTPFGAVSMGAYGYKSPILPVSVELVDDSSIDLTAAIMQILSASLAQQGANAHFTIGNGTGQPMGIVTAAASGKVGTTGQTTTVIHDDLVDLTESIDPAYHERAIEDPTAAFGFMMASQTIGFIRKIKDSAGNPIVTSDPTGQTKRPHLLGYPVYRNQDVATMAANAKSIVFGMLSKYVVRQGPIHLVRTTERYADKLQVGYQLLARWDGNLLDAGTHPVKYYANSAT